MRLIKYPLLFLLIILFFFSVTCINLFFFFSKRKRKVIGFIIHFYSRWALYVLRVRVDVEGDKEIFYDKNYLIVMNHLSYLDILIISSVVPCVFVTSLDTADYFLPFLFTKITDTVFVNRKSKTGIQKEIKHIGDILKQGFNVVLFPEATSSNGEMVLPFKSSLMKSAIYANTSVKPICIRYHAVNGGPVDDMNRDKVFWYGDMPFFSHLLGLLWVKRIRVELILLDDISVTQYTSRKILSQKAYECIFQNYHQLFSLEKFRRNEAILV